MKFNLMFHCLHRKAGILLLLAMTGILSFAVPPAFADPGDSAVITLRRDAFPPDAVTDLAASTTAIEGEIQLKWTAPADLPTGGAATSYQVRYATCSADDLLGDTTAWWNAVFEAAGEPSPSFPGTQENLIIGGLEPGVTYYFGIRSMDIVNRLSDIDDNAAAPGSQANVLVYDALPPAPADLSAVVVSSPEIKLSWQAPGVRGTDFDFNSSGVSNRFLTPNNDKKNDTVVFTFDNPKDSQVIGKIYDLTGAFIAEMTPRPQDTLEWDGTGNGHVVPGGIYIYQIKAEKKTFNGTIVVVR